MEDTTTAEPRQPPDGVKSGSASAPGARAGLARGLGLTTAGKMLEIGATFGSLMVLARLLSPAEFGLMTTGFIVFTFGSQLASAGLAPAIVQSREVTGRQLTACVLLVLALGIGTGAAVYLLSGSLAALFGMGESLAQILLAFALVLPLRAFAILGEAVQQRQMRFGFLSVATSAPYILGPCLLAIILAANGYGVWSLVYGRVAEVLMQSAILLFGMRSALARKVGLHGLRPLIRFGASATWANIASFAALNADNAIIARLMGPAQVGFYSRAFQISSVPLTLFGIVLDRVFFPLLSAQQGRPELLKTLEADQWRISALINLPLAAGGALFAPEIVYLVLGPRWADAAPILAVLMGVLAMRGFSRAGLLTLRAAGRIGWSARNQTILAVNVVIFAIIAAPYGTVWVAGGVFAAQAVNAALVLRAVRRHHDGRLTMGELVRYQMPGLTLAAALIAAGLLGSHLAVSPALGLRADGGWRAAATLAGALFGTALWTALAWKPVLRPLLLSYVPRLERSARSPAPGFMPDQESGHGE